MHPLGPLFSRRFSLFPLFFACILQPIQNFGLKTRRGGSSRNTIARRVRLMKSSIMKCARTDKQHNIRDAPLRRSLLYFRRILLHVHICICILYVCTTRNVLVCKNFAARRVLLKCDLQTGVLNNCARGRGRCTTIQYNYIYAKR